MYEKELQAMKEAALLAEAKIKEVYAKDFDVIIKSDNSPVTEADQAADKMISSYLRERFPDYGFLTEESADNDERLSKEFVFIIDPVDGTKDFVSRDGEFCTLIALVRNEKPVAGVVNCPMQNLMFYAREGGGAWREPHGGQATQIHVNDRTEQITVLRSKNFFNEREKALIDANPDKIKLVFARGSGQKYCMIAEGLAEAYFRCGGNAKEWDMAAGEILVKEAGGLMTEPDGSPLKYNQKVVKTGRGYRVANRPENLFLEK